ncbi:MAG TPA: hypothetical protein VI753_12170 [Anaerolineales bacterium]|nr:hypothetical protein [Anaerolineales bacterium]
MADKIISTKQQSLAEIRQWDFDFTADLVTGVTVESAEAVHIPPRGGTASTPEVGTISNNIVPVQLGPLSEKGWHTLKVLATLSDDEVSELRVRIPVNF